MSSVSGAALQTWRRSQLARGRGAAASLDWLLETEAGVPWVQLQRTYLEPEVQLSLKASLERMEILWSKHCDQQLPLQYLTGRCPWRDFELEVCPAVLIPRQETELLVELALALGEQQAGPPQRWADLGTGSGCIALALAAAWPASCGWAVDLSAAALAVARTNAQRLQAAERVQWCQGSWWEPLGELLGSLQMVLSNPPYIPTSVYQQLDPLVREHEPRLALDGGGDGLDCVREIVAGAKRFLSPGGWLLMELHHDQAVAVQDLLFAAGLENIKLAADLEGKSRFVQAQAPINCVQAIS
jgi:release factor glutamine methyltransferase